MGRAKDEGATPASTVPYQEFVCPNGCGRVEKGGKAPFYSQCPSCLKPAGKFLPKPASAVPEPQAQQLSPEQVKELFDELLKLEADNNRMASELAQLRADAEARQASEGPSAA